MAAGESALARVARCRQAHRIGLLRQHVIGNPPAARIDHTVSRQDLSGQDRPAFQGSSILAGQSGRMSRGAGASGHPRRPIEIRTPARRSLLGGTSSRCPRRGESPSRANGVPVGRDRRSRRQSIGRPGTRTAASQRSDELFSTCWKSGTSPVTSHLEYHSKHRLVAPQADGGCRFHVLSIGKRLLATCRALHRAPNCVMAFRCGRRIRHRRR